VVRVAFFISNLLGYVCDFCLSKNNAKNLESA
jgi:hypothetical protein